MCSILLVEDDPSIALLEREVLERSGFQVKDVQVGARALECLARCQQIVLVVLDYMLPDMTGADVIAAMGDRIADVPVIVVTGNPDPKIAEQLRGAGIFEFIIKDVNLSFLDALPKAAHAAIGQHPA